MRKIKFRKKRVDIAELPNGEFLVFDGRCYENPLTCEGFIDLGGLLDREDPHIFSKEEINKKYPELLEVQK